MDIFIENGKIVEEASGEKIDASGLIVMPGGVDIHTHIAGSKVNLGRLLRPEDHRKDVVTRTDITRSG
ncbi:MAG: amidohydrolase family protein, partial [Thermodesulfobacteriota bacterium]